MLRFYWVSFDRFKVVNLSRFKRVNLNRPYWVCLTVFSTNTPIPTENNVSLSISNESIDSTDKRVNWAQFIDGVKGWTASEEFHYTQVKEDPGFKEKRCYGSVNFSVFERPEEP